MLNIHIGCSGWQYWDWKGLFYPDTIPKKEWFNYYATQFNSVEINSTFYHFPRLSTIEKWYAAAPAEFSYSLKAPRLITHYKKFIETEAQLEAFYITASALKEKLGCILFQFPASTTYNESMLQRIVAQLKPKYQNVLEFRHASWWRDEVYAALQQHHISLCHVSAPVILPDSLTQDPHFYLRFHGPKQWFRGEYQETELKVWLEKIKTSQAKEAWVYFNNTMHGDAIKNAQLFKALSKT